MHVRADTEVTVAVIGKRVLSLAPRRPRDELKLLGALARVVPRLQRVRLAHVVTDISVPAYTMFRPQGQTSRR